MGVQRACISVVLLTGLLAGPLSRQSLSQVSGALPTLLTGEQRQAFIVEAILEYAVGLDRVVLSLTAAGRINEAIALREYANAVRLAHALPEDVLGRADVRLADVKELFDEFEQKRQQAVTACEAAGKRARAAGDLDGTLALSKECATLRKLRAGGFKTWLSFRGESRLGRGRVIEGVNVVFDIVDSRVPNELVCHRGPQRFRISGTGQHDTITRDGRTYGHFGKCVIIDEPIATARVPLEGAVRVGVARPRTTRGHRNLYQVLVVREKSIVHSYPLPLHDATKTYRWSAWRDGSQIVFSMSIGTEEFYRRRMDADGAVHLGFSATVRNPGDKSDLRVAYKRRVAPVDSHPHDGSRSGLD